MNRKPNIMYIHKGLAKGVCENGFDPNRPRVGCVIDFQSPEGLAKLKKDARALLFLPLVGRAPDQREEQQRALPGRFPRLAGRLT